MVAPTEPALLKDLGQVSSLPEKQGVDILWSSPGGLMGVQRKEVKDLLQSVFKEGRLNRELLKAQNRLRKVWLVVEGTFHWDANGELRGRYGYPWSKKAHWGLLASVQNKGINVAQTGSLKETRDWLQAMYRWSQKDQHDSLMDRPNARGEWGRATNREWGIWALQAWEGLGPRTAARLYDHFGGVPLEWTVTEKELREVPGIGVKLARYMVESLKGSGVLSGLNPHQPEGEGGDPTPPLSG